MGYNDEDEYGEAETPLIKKLRKTIDGLQKLVAEKDEEIEYFVTTSRKSTVASILEEFGVPARIAKYIPSDVDADEESISDWLYANGADFGIVPVDSDESGDDPDAAAYGAMDDMEDGGTDPSVGQDLSARIAAAKTQEELMAVLSGQ